MGIESISAADLQGRLATALQTVISLLQIATAREEPAPVAPQTHCDQPAKLSTEARSSWLAEPAPPRFNDYEIEVALDDATTTQLLLAMKRRGGTFAAVADAQMLVMRKSEDYNRDALADGAAAAKRDVYFPFGTVSYAQMIHTKAQRFVSIARAANDGGRPNFEGLLDTALDVINYAAFYVEWATRTAKGVEHASGQKEAA